jgi:hypothetical protein
MKITKDGELYSSHRTISGAANAWRKILNRGDSGRFKLLHRDGSSVTGLAYKAIQHEMDKISDKRICGKTGIKTDGVRCKKDCKFLLVEHIMGAEENEIFTCALYNNSLYPIRSRCYRDDKCLKAKEEK